MTDYIKEIWDKQAEIHSDSHCASWGDNFAIDLEIQNIQKHIENGNKVLDVGCANGYSTFNQFNNNNIEITGIDYSEKMIESALQKKATLNLSEKINFQVCDSRNLQFVDNFFDLTYTTRVLINLPTWEEQQTAIKECIRVTKPNGKIIFSEAFWEPLNLLNALRLLKNLPPLVEHDFNRYLKMNKLNQFLDSLNVKSYIVDDFSSVYYLGSRFLRELVTNPNDYEGYTNPINKIFYEIEQKFSGGGFGIQQSYVIIK